MTSRYYDQLTLQLVRFCTMKYMYVFILLVLCSQAFSQLFPKKRVTKEPKKNNPIGGLYLFLFEGLYATLQVPIDMEWQLDNRPNTRIFYLEIVVFITCGTQVL